MRDMGEKRRHGHGHGHGHLVGFGAGGVVGHAAEHEEKRMEQKKLDMSSMSMDTLPHLTTPLGNITTLDLSNNNLQVYIHSIYVLARLVLTISSSCLSSCVLIPLHVILVFHFFFVLFEWITRRTLILTWCCILLYQSDKLTANI